MREREVQNFVFSFQVTSLKCHGGLDLVELLMSMNYALCVIDCDTVGGYSSKHDDEENEDVIIVKETSVPAMAWYKVGKVSYFFHSFYELSGVT